MFIGKVIGTVWATEKQPIYEHRKLMIVQPLDLDNEPKGNSKLAIDFVDAGVGDRVLVVDEGQSGRGLVKDSTAPVKTCIIGVVDDVEIEEV